MSSTPHPPPPPQDPHPGQGGPWGQNPNPAQGNYGAPGFYGLPTGYRRPSVGMVQALKLNKKYLWHFSGRASRSEFWWAYLVWTVGTSLVVLVAYLVWVIAMFVVFSRTENSQDTSTFFVVGAVLFLLLGVALTILSIIFTLSVCWRRLQDAGFPGALWFLNLVGLGIVPFIMCMLDSSPDGLRYDKPEDVNRP
ncbi:DUF805 domain-containing protein [Rothia nasisuis]|uniref:DUF805 domain-containing protein n=1 Tax=Rothia nasisuis TaxID=2109647 RepID=UPI001F35FCCF|nr:DUF805 domain-containing protein [Rothia nasisuis]